MPAGTPVSNDLFSQALQQALQASNMSALQVMQCTLKYREGGGYIRMYIATVKLFMQSWKEAGIMMLGGLDCGDWGCSLVEGVTQWMCFCFARAAGSPRCSSSGTWGSRMRSWCWGRCRPQMVTSRLPWSSYLLEAQDSEPGPNGQKFLQRREQEKACHASQKINDKLWI